MKATLNQLEELKLHYAIISGDAYKLVLQHCPHLKHSSMRTSGTSYNIIGTGNDWLPRKYPMLERFEIRIRCLHRPQYIAELSTFFQQNSQIRALSVDSRYTAWISDMLIKQNVKFDHLVINQYTPSIRDLTTHLYEHGVYKQLHLSNSEMDVTQEDGQNLLALSNLERLHVNCYYNVISNFK